MTTGAHLDDAALQRRSIGDGRAAGAGLRLWRVDGVASATGGVVVVGRSAPASAWRRGRRDLELDGRVASPVASFEAVDVATRTVT